ncbi:MAG: hypothetical protein LBV67_01180 [Streptococcaceae bacterium]|jgi:hypothetical protein|nr:hypothetical protein [Streptococcaceae bacterium]
MTLSIQDLKGIWIENNLLTKEGDGRIVFRGATQKMVDKAYQLNKHLGLTHSDVMGIAIESAIKAIYRFRIIGTNKGWESIVEGDKDQNNKLWKIVNVSIHNSLKYIDPNIKRTFKSSSKNTVIIKPIIVSLNQPQQNNEEEAHLIELITQKNQLIKNDQHNFSSDLNQWFNQNADKILSKKQMEFIFKYLQGDFSDRNGYLPRIRERIRKERNKQGYDFSEEQYKSNKNSYTTQNSLSLENKYIRKILLPSGLLIEEDKYYN